MAEGRLDGAGQRLSREAEVVLRQADQGLAHRQAVVAALDPARTLARGWSITRTESGVLVTDPGQLARGRRIVTTLAAGELRSIVEQDG